MSYRPSARHGDSVGAVHPCDRVDAGHSNHFINFNPDKFHPLFYRLRDVKWAVFGSATWADGCRRHNSERAASLRKQDINGVLRRTCSVVRLRGKDVGIYHATEFGGGGLCHVHFLVAQEGLKHVTAERFAQAFTQQWTQGFRPFDSNVGGVGRAVVMPYNQTFGNRGVAYCLKREVDESGRERERYDYLSDKLIKTIQSVGES